MTIPMTPEYRAQIAEMLAKPYPTVVAETSVSALLAAARALWDELVQCETQLAETSADGAQWQARAETAERALAEMRAERDWQPGRWRQVRQPDGSLWMETSDGNEAEAEARKQGWPLYRLWECRETEWRPEDGDRG